MKASVVDLRYKMKDVLEALERGEQVTVFYRGKSKAVLTAVSRGNVIKVEDHPFFGSEPNISPEEVMNRLRAPRYPK